MKCRFHVRLVCPLRIRTEDDDTGPHGHPLKCYRLSWGDQTGRSRGRIFVSVPHAFEALCERLCCCPMVSRNNCLIYRLQGCHTQAICIGKGLRIANCHLFWNIARNLFVAGCIICSNITTTSSMDKGDFLSNRIRHEVFLTQPDCAQNPGTEELETQQGKFSLKSEGSCFQ